MRVQSRLPESNFSPVKHQIFLSKVFDLASREPIKGSTLSSQLRQQVRRLFAFSIFLQGCSIAR